MSSFAGIEFQVHAVNQHQWDRPGRAQDSPRTWGGTITVNAHSDMQNLEGWFTTIDARRALMSRTWTIITKAGPGGDDLVVPSSGHTLVTHTPAYLTRFEPRGDGWKYGRYFIEVEFTLS